VGFPEGVGIIFRLFVDFVWMLIKWTAALALVVAIALGFYFYHRIDDEVRRTVEAKLGAQYPHLRVSVREAQLVRGEGIRVRGLSIVEPNRSGAQEELLFIDELFVHCGTDPRDLMHAKLQVAKLTLRKPILRMSRRPDGSWSAGKLLPIPKFGDGTPTGVIESGTIEVVDPSGATPSKIVLRDAHARWETAAGDFPPGTRRPLRFQGHLDGDHVRNLAIDATFDPGGGAWSLTGSIDSLEVCPELRQSLPAPAAAGLEKLGVLRAKAQLQFKLAQTPATTTVDPNQTLTQPGQLDYQVDGKLLQGKLEDARLVYPLTDLAGKFSITPQRVSVSELTAMHGAATLRVDCDRAGLGPGAPLQLRAAARKLVLDPKMLELMPEQWKTQWNHFQPAGEVDLDAVVSFDGAAWRQQVTMTCLNVGFTYHKFPYRFERGRGKIELRDKHLTFELGALANTEEMRFIGDFQLAGPQTHGWTEIRGEGVRIDERLIRAIPETMQPLARSLHPQGRLNASMRLWKDAPGTSPMRKRIVVGLQDCFLKYDKFPYPISNVNGTVEVQDDFWIFHEDLVGMNDSGKITCRGQLTPSPGGGELILHIHGDNIRLDEELRDALNPGAQRLWNDMKPRGMLTIDSEVRYQLRDKTLRTTVRAAPIEDTVSIEPTYFPYRMEKLHGNFFLADGRLQMDKLRAEHGRTQLSAVGECLVDPNGGWRLSLDRVFVDRLVADHDLLNALPETMRKATGSLEPTGFFNVRGALSLAGSGVPGKPLTSDWNLTFDCHDNSLRCGVDLRAIFGSVTVVGRSEGGRFESTGELNLDSISYADYQLTEVMGPLWIDNEQVLLGMWADRRKGEKVERRVTGKLYGGTTVADGWIVLGDEPEYAFLATLSQGNLARFAQEHIPGNNKLSGEILATVDLRGKGRTRNNLQGRGSIQLRNADIYELPAMVSLLKVLSLRTPDATGFTSSDILFSLQGEHAYLERIDFDGDAVSLQGKGELNLLNDQINLVFRTVVGSDSARLPAVRQILGGASQQILLLYVDGTLKNPQVRRSVLPGVNQALEELQNDLNAPTPRRMTDGPTRVAPPGRYPGDRN
jgi:hypothetical protein